MRGLGTRLRAKRKLLGLSQRELADRLGVSQPAVSSWESDRERPSGAMLARIAAVLEESADYLLGSAPMPSELESLIDRLADRLGPDELEALSTLSDHDVDRLATILRALFAGHAHNQS